MYISVSLDGGAGVVACVQQLLFLVCLNSNLWRPNVLVGFHFSDDCTTIMSDCSNFMTKLKLNSCKCFIEFFNGKVFFSICLGQSVCVTVSWI